MGMIEVDEGTLRELGSLLAAVKDSATSGLAERISVLMGSLGAVVAQVEPIPASALVESAMENASALTTAIQQLGDWQRNGTWDSLTETAAVVSAFRDSATPQIAERLAGLAGALGHIAGEVGPGIAETVSAMEEHGAQLAGMLRQIGEWQNDGTWDSLVQLVTLLKGLNDSLTAHLLERLASFATEAVIDLRDALDLGLLDLGVRAMKALHEATTAAQSDTSRVTLTGLIRSLKNPQMQHAVKIMMAFMQRVPQIVAELDEPTPT